MIQFCKSHSKVSGLLALAAGVFFGATITFSNDATACTLDNWPDSSSATGQACDPNSSCPRFEGQCSYQANAAATDFVAHGAGDNGAAGTAQEFHNRFYALLTNLSAGSVVIFRAVDGSDNAVLELTATAGNPNQISLTSGGNTIASADIANGWHSVEIQRTSTNQVSLIVDETSAGSAAGSNALIANAQLGSVESTGGAGNMYFDSYIANRMTAPPMLVNCDSTNDGTVNIIDASTTATEAVGGALANGTPDCDKGGAVNIIDASITACLAVGGTNCI